MLARADNVVTLEQGHATYFGPATTVPRTLLSSLLDDSEMDEPKRTIPYTEMPELQRENDRRLRVLPMWKKSSNDTDADSNGSSDTNDASDEEGDATDPAHD